jgi:hypothetical protein
MAKSQRGSCGRVYHLCVSTLILLAGAGLLGIGIWRRVKNGDGPFNLQYSDVKDLKNVWSIVQSWSTAAIILGAALLISGLFAVIAVSRNCLGSFSKVIYFILALVLTLALGAASGVSFYLLSVTKKSADFESFIASTWEATVANEPQAICAIESDHACRGFASMGECTGCRLGVESTCTPLQRKRCAPCNTPTSTDVKNGCWAEFLSTFKRYYIIAGSVAAGLAILMFIDLCVVCGL